MAGGGKHNIFVGPVEQVALGSATTWLIQKATGLSHDQALSITGVPILWLEGKNSGIPAPEMLTAVTMHLMPHHYADAINDISGGATPQAIAVDAINWLWESSTEKTMAGAGMSRDEAKNVAGLTGSWLNFGVSHGIDKIQSAIEPMLGMIDTAAHPTHSNIQPAAKTLSDQTPKIDR
jgi:hypothetical protein